MKFKLTFMRQHLIQPIVDLVVSDYASEKRHPGTPGAEFATHGERILKGRVFRDEDARREFSRISRISDEASTLTAEEIEAIQTQIRERIEAL